MTKNEDLDRAAGVGLRDCMLDLETFGTRPGCVVRSIGALMFDPRGETKLSYERSFYVNVDRKSCEAVGMLIEPETEKWWNDPKKREAQAALLINPRPAVEAAVSFLEFWRKTGARRVWCQGGNFDEPVMTAFLEALGLSPPWKFWDARCTRTAYAVCGFDPFSVRREGTHHDALDDCRHQVICVQRAYANIAGYVSVNKKEK